ncbi:MAG: alpha-galactosidase [Clostridia bacterium]|nr:alpha-galactosidase [Clostridia bacterium]
MATYDINKIKLTSNTENSMRYEKIELIKTGEITEISVRLGFDKETSPSVYSISWEEEQIDMIGFWSSKASLQHNLTPDWYMRNEKSRTATGMPLISLYNKADINRITVALSDPASPTVISAGVVEETGTICFKIDLFSEISPKMSEYEAVIRIDRRNIPFFKAVSDVREWWSDIGYGCCYVPDSAKMPMYSTWYSFHQYTIPDEIIAECKLAKQYGMDTVIVDDGWQTDDNSRGYAFCGDWKICKNKIPDMKAFVEAVHSLGMKFMIWFSVPFVGFESENYERFKGMYLVTRQNAKASVLDPRFKEVRDFLTNIYCDYVKEYGWDGLKLDFIDSFMLSEESSDNYEKMDCISVEDGLKKLLEEAYSKLRLINPDIMIEFRQSYVGPIVSGFGNIFRVGDCPNDALINRVHSLNLRLTSKDIAVHSDMIMWNKNDTVQSVAYQLLGTIFSVPQISVRLDNITEEQKKLLKNYLSFWREHRDVLLNGSLEVFGVQANYSMAQSTKNDETVCVLYQEAVAKPKNKTLTYIFNSTGADFIYVELQEKANYEIFDIFGNSYASGSLNAGVHRLPVKNCEMVKLK